MKVIQISTILIFSFVIGALGGCQEKQSQQDQVLPGTLVRTPQSSMGKAVGAAKNLSKEADARSEELDRQAKELAGE